jgi:hypothetical protein
MPHGQFTEILHLEVETVGAFASGGQNVAEYEVPIAGRVLRPLAVYGPGIDQFGLLELGTIRSHEGLQRQLVVKVRDDERQLKVVEVRTEPEFLQANLSELGDGAAPAGVYRLEVSIPPGAPTGIHNRLNEASIHVEFDHPRIKQLKLRSRFTIIE